MLKKLYFNLFGKTTDFWPLNELLNLGLFKIHKMRVPNSHVVFSPEQNFQELQLHQTLRCFSEFLAHVEIIAFSTKRCPRFSKKCLALILFVF